jgi:hypothetical protein
MVKIFEAAGESSKAEAFRRDAARIAAALEPSFLHLSPDRSEGWLHSATGVGNQPDVWGSAFAVHSGALSAPAARAVSRALVRAYREGTAVRDGFVRHIPTTDRTNKGGWERALPEIGDYQNGGYWGTPVGWHISAVSLSDRDAAAALARDYVGFLRHNLREDGTTQAWEWINPSTGRRVNPLFVASVALPFLSLKETGLVGDRSAEIDLGHHSQTSWQTLNALKPVSFS